ncbi:hypothetical protein F4804DRAFT_210061 [Jackrogersella minutella]|nr:hypothetical protein F4804DRAFT_210061 [Jackrogersella minutella]
METEPEQANMVITTPNRPRRPTPLRTPIVGRSPLLRKTPVSRSSIKRSRRGRVVHLFGAARTLYAHRARVSNAPASSCRGPSSDQLGALMGRLGIRIHRSKNSKGRTSSREWPSGRGPSDTDEGSDEPPDIFGPGANDPFTTGAGIGGTFMAGTNNPGNPMFRDDFSIVDMDEPSDDDKGGDDEDDEDDDGFGMDEDRPVSVDSVEDDEDDDPPVCVPGSDEDQGSLGVGARIPRRNVHAHSWEGSASGGRALDISNALTLPV